jgi:acetyltransferase-like isoleucine patch superfamily enzyme
MNSANRGGDRWGISDRELDVNAWQFWSSASGEQQRDQLDYQRTLVDRGVATFAPKCFVSTLAACFPDSLSMGEKSYVAAFAYVTGHVQLGSHTTVNAYAVVRGKVTLGNGVRIGAHTSILGFNHSMQPDRPVHEQPVTTVGITVGDDVWIGSNVVIVDGVTVGAHSVIGAGAVVTKDVPPWSVMGGNPARRLRDRRDTGRSSTIERTPDDHDSELRGRLKAFGDGARAQADEVLARCWDPENRWFTDVHGESPTVRALCDAVEIADLLTGAAPKQLTSDEIVERLRSRQDPHTGLVTEYGTSAVSTEADHLGGDTVSYHVLCAGYALDILGSSFEHPITAVDEVEAAELVEILENLPWNRAAWGAGGWIDCFSTGLYWNVRWFDRAGTVETLIGWLHMHVDQHSGMWGAPTASEGLRQVVNGYYRLTRGTFAQFALPVPHPERVVDTVLAHARGSRWFEAGRVVACDVLDVIHPLWLVGAQVPGYRRDEVQAWARTHVDRVLGSWQKGAGFSFVQPSAETHEETGLQGTEMWLAIVWLLADTLGLSDELGYEPRGVHRPWPSEELAK